MIVFICWQWRKLFGSGGSMGFGYMAARGMALQKVGYYLRQANYWWIVPGVLVYFVGIWVRTWRWHYLLRPVKIIPLYRLFPLVCIGYFGNNVYPARAGEVIRAFLLRRTEGIAVSASLATIIVERVFDGLVMLLFVFFALPFVGAAHIPQVYRVTIIVASIAFFAALAFFLWMVYDQHRAARIWHFVLDHFVPARFRAPLDGFYERFMT